MKRINLAAAACLMATLAMAQTNEVTSVNVVGYYKMTIAPSGTYSLMALNLDAIDPTNQNIYGIFGTQLRASFSPSACDRILKFNTGSQTYSTYARKSSDGLYHDTANFSGAATNPALLSGQGFWIQSPSTATTNYDVVIMGEVVSVLTQSVNFASGYQLSGYMFSTDVGINNTKLTNGVASFSPGGADQILLFNGSGYTSFALKSSDRMWHLTSNFSGSAATNIIPMGQGFWYLARTNLTWTETNSYAGNL